jgi:hypothetical protein
MSTQKTPLGGRPISRKEAFKGLGDPKTWKKFSDTVYAEFRAKPKMKPAAGSPVSVVIEKLQKALHHGAGQKVEPVYAIRAKRRRAKMRASQKVRAVYAKHAKRKLAKMRSRKVNR